MGFALLYIDPTTGGLGLQILLGLLVGGFVTIKLMWARFLSFFRREKAPTDEAAASTAQSSAETGGED